MARIKVNGADLLKCSFCGKPQRQVWKLIAGPGVYICSECIGLCIEIYLEEESIDKVNEEFETRGFKIIAVDTLGKPSYYATPAKPSYYATPAYGTSPYETAYRTSPYETTAKPPSYATSGKKKESGSVGASDTTAFVSVFGPRDAQIGLNTCFYLGPFTEPFNTIYKDHVVPALANSGFYVTRADEIFSTHPIVEDIWQGINSAEFLIADLSGKNPNVMYEVGMAHTIGKHVLMLSQSVEDIPFDLRHWRCLIYEYTPPGCRKLEKGITESAQYFRRNRSEVV